jgi:hypothetical protein
MTDTKYNGYTNYQTWRVKIEMIDSINFAQRNDFDAYDLGQVLRDYAFEMIDMESFGFAYDYASAFLNQVNWYEIAEHQINDFREKAE